MTPGFKQLEGDSEDLDFTEEENDFEFSILEKVRGAKGNNY